MSRPDIFLTGHERTFGENQIIVSKTDLRGIITYANKLFLDVAGYALEEVMQQPHNVVRHSAMPRCVFKLLWDRIALGHEVFAYVVNRAKNGDHYWVFAHVTPSYDDKGKIISYHSSRRSPRRDAIRAIEPVYKQLLATENACASPKDGLAAGEKMLQDFLAQKGTDYDRLIHSI
jgi:PAS domain S-box-containing protein